MAEAPYLLDVNVLIALTLEVHEHHRAAVNWFDVSGRQWALCPWSEAGFLRFVMRNKGLSSREAASVLEELEEHPGYHFQPIIGTWRTLTEPFSRRIHGHKQVTDACLLGLAIYNGLLLATFDRAILHLAGEHSRLVHVLG